MEDRVIQIKEQKNTSKNFSSFSNALIKEEKISSKKASNHKKIKGRKKLKDISNQIELDFKYENFEQETEAFYPQIYRVENTISIENVSLLDQSHFRFIIKKMQNYSTNITIISTIIS